MVGSRTKEEYASRLVAYKVAELQRKAAEEAERAQALASEHAHLEELYLEVKTSMELQILQLGTLAHDLRNPIGAILSSAQMLEEQEEIDRIRRRMQDELARERGAAG